MKKQDLYNFIETKIASLKRIENEKEKNINQAIRESVAKEVKGLDAIADKFSNLSDLLEKSKSEHEEAFSWTLNDMIRNCNNLIDFKKSLINSIYNDVAIANLHRDRQLVTLQKKYPDTLSVIDSVRPKYKSICIIRANIKTLEVELNSVIKASKTAKDAYKNLVALGVDMKDLEENPVLLPAVQKLSVNVCILNGDC
jgi:hypothetical protein